MLLFAAATQGWFLSKNRYWESAALLLIAFTLFRPGFWMDMVVPPYAEKAPSEIATAAFETPAGEDLRVRVNGVNEVGDPISFVALIPMGSEATGEERILGAGIELSDRDGKTFIENVAFDSAAQKAGLDWDQEVVNVLKVEEQPSKYWMFLPALLLLGVLVKLQRGREEKITIARAGATESTPA